MHVTQQLHKTAAVASKHRHPHAFPHLAACISACPLHPTVLQARKRKLDAVMHQEPEQLQGTHAPGVGPVRPHPPSSSAAQQQPEGQPHLLSTSSARSSALDASTGVRLQALASEGTINDASASEVAEYAVWFQDKHDKLGPLPDPNLDNTRGMLEPALVQQQPTPTCLPDTAVRQDKEGAQSCQAISVSTDMLQAGTGAQLPAVQQPKAGVAGGVPSTTAAAAAAAAAAAGALHTWDMPHLDSVASSSERTGGATAPPTAQPAAAAAAAAPPAGGHPVMGPPPLLEQLLPQAAPSVLPPWGPVAGTEGQEGLEQQQQLSDQEQGCSAAALSLLADAGEWLQAGDSRQGHTVWLLCMFGLASAAAVLLSAVPMCTLGGAGPPLERAAQALIRIIPLPACFPIADSGCCACSSARCQGACTQAGGPTDKWLGDVCWAPSVHTKR
jgi:hypothetical protein